MAGGCSPAAAQQCTFRLVQRLKIELQERIYQAERFSQLCPLLGSSSTGAGCKEDASNVVLSRDQGPLGMDGSSSSAWVPRANALVNAAEITSFPPLQPCSTSAAPKSAAHIAPNSQSILQQSPLHTRMHQPPQPSCSQQHISNPSECPTLCDSNDLEAAAAQQALLLKRAQAARSTSNFSIKEDNSDAAH